MKRLLDRLHKAVDDFIWSGAPYPREWHDPTWLHDWEQAHLDPRSGVWAIDYDCGALYLYPPGAPWPAEWPDGVDPYRGVRPAGEYPQPEPLMPYPPEVMRSLLAWVRHHSGGVVQEHISGLRAVNGEPTVPTMFVKISEA